MSAGQVLQIGDNSFNWDNVIRCVPTYTYHDDLYIPAVTVYTTDNNSLQILFQDMGDKSAMTRDVMVQKAKQIINLAFVVMRDDVK